MGCRSGSLGYPEGQTTRHIRLLQVGCARASVRLNSIQRRKVEFWVRLTSLSLRVAFYGFPGEFWRSGLQTDPEARSHQGLKPPTLPPRECVVHHYRCSHLPAMRSIQPPSAIACFLRPCSLRVYPLVDNGIPPVREVRLMALTQRGHVGNPSDTPLQHDRYPALSLSLASRLRAYMGLVSRKLP
jgi:hypothetical protein